MVQLLIQVDEFNPKAMERFIREKGRSPEDYFMDLLRLGWNETGDLSCGKLLAYVLQNGINNSLLDIFPTDEGYELDQIKQQLG
jgi:hypothetical protein